MYVQFEFVTGVLVCDAMHTAAQNYQNISDCLKSGPNKTLRNRVL